MKENSDTTILGGGGNERGCESCPGEDKLTPEEWLSDRYAPSQEMVERVLMKYGRKGIIAVAPYTIIRMRSSGDPTDKSTLYSTHGIYPDAEFGFVLTKNEIPIASIWFNVLEDRILFVKQLQGRRGYQEDLTFFRWERMLLRLLVEWGMFHNFKEIRVVRGIYQEWCKNWDDRKRQFHITYDVTAKREGFAPDVEYHRLVIGREGRKAENTF